ncbi:MAG: cell wall hydrolase [Rhodothermales bacterium]
MFRLLRPNRTLGQTSTSSSLRVVRRYLVSISLVIVVSSSLAFRAGTASAAFTPMPFDRESLAVGVLPMATHQTEPIAGFATGTAIVEWSNIPDVPLSEIDDETLWLARCIFSETKDPEEMELVGWVVRNRVETRYRGQSTYKGVILDPFQFSAFNPTTPTLFFYSALPAGADLPGWRDALRIAYIVKTDDGRRRPFSIQTRHFYSELSMVGRRHPVWASGLQPVSPHKGFSIDDRRFRFYEGIS